MELEKVGPRLRILLAADTKDWRTNLEEVHSNSKVGLTSVGLRGHGRCQMGLFDPFHR